MAVSGEQHCKPQTANIKLLTLNLKLLTLNIPPKLAKFKYQTAKKIPMTLPIKIKSKKAQDFMASNLGKIVFALAVLIVLILIISLTRGKIWDQISKLGRVLRVG